jgi:hypothetical protein
MQSRAHKFTDAGEHLLTHLHTSTPLTLKNQCPRHVESEHS